MDAQTTVNPVDEIDRRPISSLQVLAILLCGLVAILDGNDTQALAITLRPLATSLGVPAAAMGWAVSGTFAGAALGALIFGVIGDRIGRKRALVAAVVMFGLFTLVTPMATNLPELVLLRILTGIGLGGATPCFIALASEYAPSRIRSAVASAIWACFPLGVLVGGVVNGALIAAFGSWQIVYIVGGGVALALACVLLVLLPESLSFLLARESRLRHANRILARIAPEIVATAPSLLQATPPPSAVGLGPVLDPVRKGTTLYLWLVLFSAFGTTAATSWVPAILAQQGTSLPTAAVIGSFSGFGALFGMTGAGWLVERFGVVWAMVLPAMLGAVAALLLGLTLPSLLGAAVFVAAINAFVGGSASAAIALFSRVYPPNIRASGAGWGMGMARLGQVVIPGCFAGLLGQGFSGDTLFMLLGIVPLIVAGAAWGLHKKLQHESAGQRLSSAQVSTS